MAKSKELIMIDEYKQMIYLENLYKKNTIDLDKYFKYSGKLEIGKRFKEPKEDYVEEWKRFCMEIVQDRSKEKAIALAKILIKDVELFEDVLDLAGQNQSIGSEILRKMEESTKNMV